MERPLPGEQLVEDRAEGEYVRSDIGLASAHLLGRHVADGPEDDARLGARGRRRQVRRLAALFEMRQLGQSEVQDFDPAALRDEDVLRLQVPVNDPLLVRGGEAVGDLEGVVDRLALRELSAGERRAQCLSLEQLLDDVGRSIVRPDVVNSRDVGVVQDPGGARLLLESAQAVRVGGERRRQDLDRDLAPQSWVLRPVDFAHSPRAQRRDDLVGAQPAPRSNNHFAMT